MIRFSELEVPQSWVGSPLHRALHTVWTKAVGTNDYVKSEWRLLDDLITKLFYQLVEIAQTLKDQERELTELKQERALDKNAWRRMGEVMGLTKEESAHTSHVIATLATIINRKGDHK